MITPLSDQDLHNLLNFLATKQSFAFFETTKITPTEYHSLLFLNPIACITCDNKAELDLFFKQAADYLKQGYYLAGWFTYEFGYALETSLFNRLQTNSHAHPSRTTKDESRNKVTDISADFYINSPAPLANLTVYKRVHIFNHLSQTFNKSGPWPTGKGQLKPDCHQINNLHLSIDKNDYLKNIARIKQYLAAGDTYQVNYTLKLLFNFDGSPEALYKELRRNQHVSFGAYLKSVGQQIISLSPELFFKKKGQSLTVRPMKGTKQRGYTIDNDSQCADFLRHDPKNRSENVMIVDLLRNDLGRLCEPGSVNTTSLFEVETYETLHQMTSTIKGRLRPDISLSDIFHGLFPCGSITGTPKIRTMEIIHELEQTPRHIYTGGIGFITPQMDMVFNVPIRTVVLAKGRGEMGIGSGIVHDSDPDKEWDECRLKGDFLTRPTPVFELIETILWQPKHGYWLLNAHLGRLISSAQYFNYAIDKKSLLYKLEQTANNFPSTAPQRVRLTLHKDGSYQITTRKCAAPARLSLSNCHKSTRQRLLTFATTPTDSKSPYLYHKTTMRKLYDTERQKAITCDFFEVIFTNEKEEITEGSISNIFIRNNDKYLTPPISCGLLDGVFRKYLLTKYPFKVKEKILYRKDLESAEAIYVGNSVRGLVQVTLG